jgi:hypothetical protein
MYEHVGEYTTACGCAADGMLQPFTGLGDAAMCDVRKTHPIPEVCKAVWERAEGRICRIGGEESRCAAAHLKGVAVQICVLVDVFEDGLECMSLS